MRTLPQTRAHRLLTRSLRLMALSLPARETGRRCGVWLRGVRGECSGALAGSGGLTWRRLCA